MHFEHFLAEQLPAKALQRDIFHLFLFLKGRGNERFKNKQNTSIVSEVETVVSPEGESDWERV